MLTRFTRFGTAHRENEKLAKQEMLLYILYVQPPPLLVRIPRDFAVKIFAMANSNWYAIGAVLFEYAKRHKTKFYVRARLSRKLLAVTVSFELSILFAIELWR